jgi:collagenase-like PrtC family protease
MAFAPVSCSQRLLLEQSLDHSSVHMAPCHQRARQRRVSLVPADADGRRMNQPTGGIGSI